MACPEQDNGAGAAAELIAERGLAGLSDAVSMLINEAMRLERERHLAVAPYERSPQRTGYANGYKPKTVRSRVGALELAVPQVREGGFYPQSLDKGLRSERALKLALAEMYVSGVSTRKVARVTESLCGFEVSSTEVSRCAEALDDELTAWRQRPLGVYAYVVLDARYEKMRHGGTVIDCAVLLAMGIDTDGRRELLGVDEARNAQRLSNDEIAIAELTRLANTQGPVSAALNDAADAVRDGASTADAARGVLAALRRGDDIGGDGPSAPAAQRADRPPGGPDGPEPAPGGRGDGSPGGAAELEPPQGGPRVSETARGGSGGDDLFGPRPVQEQALSDAQRAKDAARSPGTDVDPGVDGGLFSNQSRQLDIGDAPAERDFIGNADAGDTMNNGHTRVLGNFNRKKDAQALASESDTRAVSGYSDGKYPRGWVVTDAGRPVFSGWSKQGRNARSATTPAGRYRATLVGDQITVVDTQTGAGVRSELYDMNKSQRASELAQSLRQQDFDKIAGTDAPADVDGGFSVREPRRPQLPRGQTAGGAREIGAVYDFAKQGAANEKRAVSWGDIDEAEAAFLRDQIGLDLPAGARHTVDNFAIRHAEADHGQDLGGLTREDYQRIPEVVREPDTVSNPGKDRQGNDLIRYGKRFNGVTYVVEEVRTGRGELALKTLFKRRTAIADDPPARVPTRTSEALGRRPEQGASSVTASAEVFLPPAAADAAHSLAERGAGRTVRHVQTGTFPSGLRQVRNADDVAHVVAPLRRDAQESVAVVATDDAGNVLRIGRVNRGTATGAEVDPATVAGTVLNTPGATRAWIAHNHPSGSLVQSVDDGRLARQVKTLLDGTDVTFEGGVVVAPGGRVSSRIGPNGILDFNPTRALPRRGALPVTERRLVGSANDQAPITGPQDAAARIHAAGGGKGVLLLDSDNRPLRFVDLTDDQLRTLRGGGSIGRINALSRVVESTPSCSRGSCAPALSACIADLGNERGCLAG